MSKTSRTLAKPRSIFGSPARKPRGPAGQEGEGTKKSTAARAQGCAGRKQLPLGGTKKRKVRLEERWFRPADTQVETKSPLGRIEMCPGRLEVTKGDLEFPLGETKLALLQSPLRRVETNLPLCRLKKALVAASLRLGETTMRKFETSQRKYQTKVTKLEVNQRKGGPAERNALQRLPVDDHPERCFPMTTTSKPASPIAILKLPKSVPALVTYAQAIVTAVTGNPSFPSPVPSVVTVAAAIAALHAAESTALTRAKGAVADRDDKRAALVALLKQWLPYVQTVADANVETAATVIQSAGIAVKKVAVRKPRVFVAEQGEMSGSAMLVAASAGRRASYEWQYSTDGGKTWVLAPVSLQAKTTVAGLTPGATVDFRYRPVTKTGEGNWSQTVQLIVK
jgi:hypothetical protein